jgi:hypothetical protein
VSGILIQNRLTAAFDAVFDLFWFGNHLAWQFGTVKKDIF